MFKRDARRNASLAVLVEKGVDFAELVRDANANGWWYRATERNKTRAVRWHFVKVANSGEGILQTDYVVRGVSWPPRIVRVHHKPTAQSSSSSSDGGKLLPSIL